MSEEHVPAKLYIWPKDCLFIEHAPIPTSAYKTVFDKLVISLDNDITLNLSDGKTVNTRSYLIKAGTKVGPSELNSDLATKAIYYIAPVSQDYYAIADSMKLAYKNLYYDHENEAELITTFADIQADGYQPEETYSAVRSNLFSPTIDHKTLSDFDSRIADVIDLIEHSSSQNISIGEFAEQVHLSASRLEKLFKEQVGIPITTYRLRYRVYIGVLHLALGASITDAAYASGFSNLAHFSRSFIAIHGVQPSFIFSHPVRLHTFICQEVLATNSNQLNGLNAKNWSSGKHKITGHEAAVFFFDTLDRAVGS